MGDSIEAKSDTGLTDRLGHLSVKLYQSCVT